MYMYVYIGIYNQVQYISVKSANIDRLESFQRIPMIDSMVDC